MEFGKETALVKYFLVKPKATGKGKGNPGTKGAKKGSAGGSKGYGKGKNPMVCPTKMPIRTNLQLPLVRRKT